MKRAQLDNPIIIFVALVFGLMIFAPIMLKIFISIDTGVGNSLGNLSGQQGVIAKQNFDAVTTPLITFWDKVITMAFVLVVILLFVSAFFVDAHPFFLILYILLNFFVILMVPNLETALSHIYDSPTFVTETAQLVFLDSLRTNLTLFTVGIMVLAGIVIYGKLAFTRGGSNRR